MPTKSEKQAKTMRAAAHNPEFAKKVGIPVDVAKEFVEADKKKADAEKKKKGHASSKLTARYGKEA